MSVSVPSPSFWRSIRIASGDVLSSPFWWRQQSWVIVTEILMGFLAAWGLVRHISPAWIGLGLGLVYAINSAGVWSLRTYGRRAGILLLLGSIAVLVATGFAGGLSRWLGLCATIGMLLTFRDHQTVHSLAWMPVRALRRGGNNLMSLTVAAVIGAILLACCLFAAGLISQSWRWLPHALVLVAMILLVPRQIMRLGRGAGRLSTPIQMRAAHRDELSWLLRLGVAFNAVNFLGRRLLLPGIVLLLAKSYVGSEAGLPILGAALGLMGVVGSLARAPVVLSNRIDASTLLLWGARLTLLGWAILSIGVIAWPWMPASAAMVPVLLGWSMLEFTNRTWSVAYMEQIRHSSVGSRFSAARAHRRALSRFMVRKSAGGAVGCAAGGLVAPALLPALVVLLVVGCWAMLERGPSVAAK